MLDLTDARAIERDRKVGAGLGVVAKYQRLGRPLTTEEQSELCRELEEAIAERFGRPAEDPLVVLDELPG